MPNDRKDVELDLLMDDVATLTKPAQKRDGGKKTIRVRSSVEKARDDYRAAKKLHKAEIKRLKAQMRLQRKIAKNNIKAHRNMIATAKTSYKAIKFADKR